MALARPSIDGKACAPIVQHPRNHNDRQAREGWTENGATCNSGCSFFRPSILLKRARAIILPRRSRSPKAEQLGFTHARTVEHYFERYGGYSPNPIVFLAAVSQRTKTMRLVTGAVLP